MKWILASKSPRRSEILQNLGIPFTVVTAETDEDSDERDPYRLVEELARRKGEAVRSLLLLRGEDLRDTVVLSSDTVVWANGEILGKPHDAKDAVRMLRMLSGRTHEVVSGICLLSATGCGVAHEVTKVCFDRMDEESIQRYIERTNPYDKAGAYAIQGEASLFIRGIEGDYFNVVGLPVHRLHTLYYEIFKENLL